MIPSSPFASGFHATLVTRFPADQVQGDVTQHRHRLSPSVPGSSPGQAVTDPGRLFLKAYVKHPMERIPDTPSPAVPLAQNAPHHTQARSGNNAAHKTPHRQVPPVTRPCQHPKQVGNGSDVVGLATHPESSSGQALELTQNEPIGTGPSADHVQSILVRSAVKEPAPDFIRGAPQGLAINANHLLSD